MKLNQLHFFSKTLLVSMIVASCNLKGNSNSDRENREKDTLVHLEPSKIHYNRLSDSYINEKKSAINRYFTKYWEGPNKNISFLVAKDGQIIYEKYQGFADKKKGTTINYNTPLHIASVSKVLTATAILELVDAGKISLDQKANTILKTFPYPEVTVRHLLSHRSGMRNYAYFTEDKGVWDRKKTISNDDVLRLLGEKKIQLESRTNSRFAYCNTNYAILALIIEKTTGMKYPVAMKKMIFDPLKMTDTYVFEIEKHRKTAVPSYKASNMELAIDYLDAVYGDKNIYSTPRDLLKFDLARNSPSFLSKKLRDQIYVGYSNEKKGTRNYGLGIRMLDWESGQHFYFHNGWWHGSTSSYITLKKENATIIALSNKYTTLTYKFKDLSPLFGDYPFKKDSNENEE
ncbi:MAG: serine hydrolase domain-containing protein [Flavobacterium sp.]